MENFRDSFSTAIQAMIATNVNTQTGFLHNQNTLPSTKDYTLKEVLDIINTGSLESKQNLSRNYFYKNSLYKKLILTYANLLKYEGILIPNVKVGQKISTPAISKRYFSAIDFVESLNLPQLLYKFSLTSLIYGAYYGIITNYDKSNFLIIDLPNKYCCTRFKDEKGNDLIEFNVEYFNTLFDKESKEKILSIYPKFILKYYKRYQEGKEKEKWIVIPSTIGVCFPFLEDGRPPFLPLIPGIIRYEDAVDLEQERELDEIRKIIVQTVPHMNDGKLLFEPPEAQVMHEGAVGMMKGNKNVSVLTSYADTQAIISKTSGEAKDNYSEKMLQNYYNLAGTSPQIFSSTGSSTLDQSLNNDLSIMMILVNRFSLFLTSIVNTLFSNGSINFKYKILPLSYYNEDKFLERSLKLAQSGYSFTIPALASGLSQRDLIGVKDLENELFNLTERLLPLKSSYTSTDGQKEKGGQKKAAADRTEKTNSNEEAADKTMGGEG